MKSILRLTLPFILLTSLTSLIIRHDVADEKFINLAKNYTQVCHLPDGESTLIAPLWVVTAAHAAELVVDEMNNGQSISVRNQGKQYPVEKVIIHPDFAFTNRGLQSDLALIKLKNEVEGVTPVQLYGEQDETGKLITVVGSGDTGTGLTGPQNYDQVTRAGTNLIDGVRKEWIYFKFDAPGSPNSTELEAISGPGDSGGPAFIEVNGVLYLAGISSFQMDDGQEGVYGVTEYYTRVSNFKNWIEETISSN